MDFPFDVEKLSQSVVQVRSLVPPQALTASVLGIERLGHGVVIEPNLVLTIGYLITEASEVWLAAGDGRKIRGDVLGYDQETGFGLVQALGRLDIEPIALGSSHAAQIGDAVLVAGSGGPAQAIAGRLVAKQSFSGYWEYHLDEALFTAPAHPNWGGTAVIDCFGRLIGIGSLNIQDAEVNGRPQGVNMVVPIDLLKPLLGDLKAYGRPNRPARPWLGLYGTESDGRVLVIGVAERGPARDAGIEPGDVLVAVGTKQIESLEGFYRDVWASGPAGCDVILSILRNGSVTQAVVVTVDRAELLWRPVLH
ncbi:MAG: S1C family serine protease [Hyphomicrobiaceae bacterium]